MDKDFREGMRLIGKSQKVMEAALQVQRCEIAWRDAVAEFNRLVDDREQAVAKGKGTMAAAIRANDIAMGPSASSTGAKAKAGSKSPTGAHGVATGLTEKVRSAFQDGKVHTSKDLRDQFEATSLQIKKTLNNLKTAKEIKPSGPKGSYTLRVRR